MSDWKEYKLSDIAEVTTGFPFKGNKYSNNGIRVVRGENVTIGDLRWDTIKCWNEDFDQLDKYTLRNGDIVIGMDGSRVGKNRAQIRVTDLPLLLAQRVACVRAKKGYSQDLIAYLIKSYSFEKYVEMVHTGTSIPHISQKQIEEFKIVIPRSLPTQIAIAEILSSLDDKIELNNKINQELENLAQTLFNQWFIDFEFPNENGEPYKSSGGEMVDSELGEIPKGWEIGRFSDLVKISTGKGINKKDYLNDGSYPIIGANGIMGYCANYNIEGFKILTGRVGTLGTVRICNEKAWTSDNVLICEPIYVEVNHYSYFVMKDFDYKSLNRGSTQPLITQTDLKIQSIVSPPKNILFPFQSQMDCFLSILESNILENNFLTTLRDTLLPKLISGELEVSQIQTTS